METIKDIQKCEIMKETLKNTTLKFLHCKKSKRHKKRTRIPSVCPRPAPVFLRFLNVMAQTEEKCKKKFF